MRAKAKRASSGANEGKTPVMTRFGFGSPGQGGSVNIRLVSQPAQAGSGLAWFAGMDG
jgi:hypothetical protein